MEGFDGELVGREYRMKVHGADVRTHIITPADSLDKVCTATISDGKIYYSVLGEDGVRQYLKANAYPEYTMF